MPDPTPPPDAPRPDLDEIQRILGSKRNLLDAPLGIVRTRLEELLAYAQRLEREAQKPPKRPPADPIYVTTDRELHLWHIAMGRASGGRETTTLCGLAAPGGKWDLTLLWMRPGWGSKGCTGQSLCLACSSTLAALVTPEAQHAAG